MIMHKDLYDNYTLALDKGSKYYPTSLKSIKNPPRVLYVKTKDPENLSNIFKNCVGIVGSRKMSLYGSRVTDKLFNELSKDITVVSGFMYGVDTKALETALDKGIKTIGILPCGIDKCHPAGNHKLYKNILTAGGLIISENPDNFDALKWSFPKRNRIIAGLCKVLIVIEAKPASGTLITANYSNEFDRPVYAVVTDIFNETMQGNMQILQSFAKPLFSGYQINESLNLSGISPSLPIEGLQHVELSPLETSILDNLKQRPSTIDQLNLKMCISMTKLITEVNMLALKGTIKESGGYFYVV